MINLILNNKQILITTIVIYNNISTQRLTISIKQILKLAIIQIYTGTVIFHDQEIPTNIQPHKAWIP